MYIEVNGEKVSFPISGSASAGVFGSNGTSWSGDILQGVFDEKLTISADNVEVDIQ